MKPHSTIAILLLAATGLMAQLTGTDTNGANGFYYVSLDGKGQTMANSDGSTVRLGQKAEIQISKAYVYSQNNANTGFDVMLYTSDFAPVSTTPSEAQNVKPIALRVGDHVYTWKGYGGNGGNYNDMQFEIHGQDGAMAMAKWLSVGCKLRSPPGYKFSAQFVPTQSEFHTIEPVLVKFVMRNRDSRTIIFQSGGQQRGCRDNQYGFRAMYQYGVPMTDAGNPVNFGGLCQLINLEPGKEFEGQIDLKKWFNFDKAGTYSIHGFYRLDFYPSGKESDVFRPWNVMWSDYASADFTVVVK
jgi:hypothetical protein